MKLPKLLFAVSLLATMTTYAGTLMTFNRGKVNDGLGKQAFWTVPGTPITIKMDCKNDNAAKSQATFKWRIVNESGDVMENGSFEEDFADKYSHSFPIAIVRHGVYRLEITCVKNNQESRGEALFAVLPQPADKRVRDGIFGGAVSSAITTMVPYLGLTCNRRHCAMGETTARTNYFTGQGTGRIFNPEFFNEQFNNTLLLENKYGLEPLGDTYDSSGKNLEFINKATDEEWGVYQKWWINNYLIPLVTAGKGQIKYWEIENEPYYPYKDRPDRYVSLLKEAYESTKKIDPSIQVVGPSGPPDELGEKFWHGVFSLGALKYIDIVSFHKYCFANKTIMSSDARFVKWFKRLREIIKQYGGEGKELWNTETSISPPATMYTLKENLKNVRYLSGAVSPMPREQAAVATRVLAVHYAYGIKYNFHLYSYNPTYTCHPFEFDGTPIAFAVSYAWMSRTLEGKESLGNISSAKRVNWYAFKNKENGKLVTLGWIEQLYPGETAKLELPEELRANNLYDIFGNPTSKNVKDVTFKAEPIYLEFEEPSDKILSLMKEIKLSLNHNKTVNATEKKICQNATEADWVGYMSIDLAPYVNRGFTDDKALDKNGGFTDEGDNDLKFMPTGNILVNGVPFSIIDPAKNNEKSCLVMGSILRNYFPYKVSVKIPDGGKRITDLHFLQLATNLSGKDTIGKRIGKYVINYADGYKEEIPLIAGQNVLDWWNIKQNPVSKTGILVPNIYNDNGVCVRHLSWTSSHPKGAHAMMTSIDIDMEKDAKPIFVLLAITGSLSN